MKKKLSILILIFFFISATAAYSFSQIRGKTLSSSEVKKRWGNDKFNSSKFKEGNQKIKSQMAYSLLKAESKWIGKDVDEVRSKLGSPDGHYFVDIHPAYIIQEGQTASEDTWQIVFSLDNSFKVKKIFAHKNCCDN